MAYNFYNFKIKTDGASILHTPRGKHENEIMKSGDGQPFNKDMQPIDGVTIIGCSFNPDDSFTGSNGDPPDTDRWTAWTAVDGKCDIWNNRLRMYSNTYGGLARCTNNAQFDGDFDIQIEWFVSSAGGSIPVYWYINLVNNSNSNQIRLNNGNDPGQSYDDYINVQEYDGSWTTPYKSHESYFGGKTKFVRTGSSLAIWASNDSVEVTDMTLRNTMVGFGTGKCTWRIDFPNSSNNNLNTLYFDNFTFNAGIMDCT